MKPFKLSILSCDHLFYEGECESLVVPTTDGEIGILADHSNIVAATVPGTIKFKVNEEWQYGCVSEGIVEVENGDVLILVNTIEKPEEIDEAYQKRRIEELNEEFQQKQSILDYQASKARMARAMARLKSKEYGSKF